MRSTVRLSGGLGNQMFQYAFGRRLATAPGLTVSFDVENGFRGDPFARKFSLDAFEARIVKAIPSDIPLGIGWHRPWRGLAKVGWRVLPRAQQRLVEERVAHQCDAEVLSMAAVPGKYYSGYWQNEGYFLPVQDALRGEFALRQPLRPAFRALTEEMAGCRSVSVHARRCVEHDQAKVMLSRCDGSYFQRAVMKIGVTAETVYYIFSDIPAWAKSNLKLPGICRYVADLGPWSDGEELVLMSGCQHHVISNSTFGWWGAWLGKNPAKVIVAPKIWGAEMPTDRINICPPGWLLA